MRRRLRGSQAASSKLTELTLSARVTTQILRKTMVAVMILTVVLMTRPMSNVSQQYWFLPLPSPLQASPFPLFGLVSPSY